MRCYVPDPELPFRPTGLVFALLAHDADVRRSVFRALDRANAIDPDRRCVWPQAEQIANDGGHGLAAHVLHVMIRDVWRHA